MKKLLTSLFLIALAVVAAPPVGPTLAVTCDGGISSFGCAQPHFVAGPIDPTKTYEIDGIGPSGSLEQIWYPDPSLDYSGTIIDMPTNGAISVGSWTFELHEIGHNGSGKHKVLASDSETF